MFSVQRVQGLWKVSHVQGVATDMRFHFLGTAIMWALEMQKRWNERHGIISK